MKEKIKPYGRYIEIHGKRMYVSVSGNDSNVILLLPGLNSACPIIEMKALTSYLTDKYMVVTIEYLGYGMSDNASEERTIENIVDDIHEAMSVLGYKKYSIVGHSIAGLYCLLYTNKYPDEVINFIGIDPSVPQQIDYTDEIEKMLALKLKQRESHSVLTPVKVRFFSKRFLKTINDYDYSKDDLVAYSEMAVKAIKHGSVINELQNAENNFNKMKGTKFPDEVNALLLLASRSESIFPHWLEWHEEILNTTGKIETLEGMHILHIQHPELVAEKIDCFISDNLSDSKNI